MELQEIPGYVPAALVICVTKALRLDIRTPAMTSVTVINIMIFSVLL